MRPPLAACYPHRTSTGGNLRDWPALRAHYAAHGYARLGAVASSAQQKTAHVALSDHLPPAQTEPTPYGVLRHNLWTQVPALAGLLTDGSIGALAANLLDIDFVQLFQDNLIWKPPGTQKSVRWHQDYAYWPLDRPQGVTLWLALDDADPGNGCMSYLPGSHALGERQATDFVAGSNQPLHAHLPAFDASAHSAEAVPMPVRAGHMVAHHPLLWHTSPGNPGPRHRRAWSLTFIDPTVRWAPAHAPHPDCLGKTWVAGGSLRGPRYPRFERTPVRSGAPE